MRGEFPEIRRNPVAFLAGGALFCILAGSAFLITRTLVPGTAPTAVEVASSHGPMSLPHAQAVPAAPRVEVSPTAGEAIPEVRIRTAPQPTPEPPGEEETPILAPEVKISDRREEIRAIIEGVSKSEGPSSPIASPARKPERSTPPDPQRRIIGEPPVPVAPVPATTGSPLLVQPPSEPEVVPAPAPPAPSRPRLRSRLREAERREARLPQGRLSLYFDADSSTFSRSGDRMPLAVEVWVDGVLKLRSGDPEKRDFDLGRLPAGWHEVEVVPHVGDLPTQSRRRSVRIAEDETVSYRVVLRREDGMACISKFKMVD